MQTFSVSILKNGAVSVWAINKNNGEVVRQGKGAAKAPFSHLPWILGVNMTRLVPSLRKRQILRPLIN